MDIADSMEDLIGNTPMVRLVRVTEGIACPIVAKLETTNPGGSVKDRPALAMIDAAEREGLLQPGGTIIEPTSGNTGVGLAIVAAQRGYKCIFVMTDKVSEEKVTLLRAYGAEVVVCPVAVAPEDPQSYYSTAERLVNETPGAFRPNQYHNPVNPQSHYDTTGPEIWHQTDGKITHFIAGAGTGGTISGIGKYLKEQNPEVKIIAADPEGSVYSGGSGRPYLVEGVGEDFWPDTYDPTVVDDVIAISDAYSFEMARRVTMEEGLLIGGSCGTAVAAALEVGRGASPDDLVVVLIPDSGRGYLSKIFNDDWMSSFGFLTADGVIVSDVIGTKESGVPPLVYIQPETRVKDAIDLMQKHSVSQLPVAKGEMPLAAAEVQGSVSELFLMERVFGGDDVLSKAVEEVMAPALPTIGIGEPIELAVHRLDSSPALLVLDGGRPRTVISRTDVLSYLQAQDALGAALMSGSWGFETKAVHVGQEPDEATGAVTVPVYQTSTYAQDAVGKDRGYEYSRTGNPTRSALETSLAALEGAAYGRAFASGMAAEDTILRMLRPGDHLIMGNDAYGGTYRLITRVIAEAGVEWSAVDLDNADQVDAALRPETRLLWTETPTNPMLGVVDIAQLAEVAHANDARLVVDNTFATPYLQQPLDHGADIVVHSTTKYAGGHSDVVGGFVATNDADTDERLGFLQNAVGAVPGPMDCYLLLRGLKTLAVRMDRHCDNAEAVVGFLQGHAGVSSILYPGLAEHPGHAAAARQMKRYGGMVSFIVGAGAEAANELVARTEVFTLAESLGAVESLIEVPAAMTHLSVAGSSLAVDPALVRLSVGIETAEDLIADLAQAFDAIS